MKLLDLFTTTKTGFALAMAPGFFRKYMYTGTLQALEDSSILNLKAVGGSSAGAIVSGFLACGLKPSELSTMLFDLNREEFWELAWTPPLLFGLLKGERLIETFESKLLLPTFEECKSNYIPMGVTAYDVFRRKTRVITTGSLSRAMAASCCVPVMFQPVWIDYSPHIDGGIFDSAGMMALPCPFEDEEGGLVVNLLCAKNQLLCSFLPSGFPATTVLLSVVIENAPVVSPFTMKETGPQAHQAAKLAMLAALQSPEDLVQISERHFVSYIDCSSFVMPESVSGIEL